MSGYIQTTLHPCSVESINRASGIFCVGMYELNESTNHRDGALATYVGSNKVDEMKMSSGVLDMKTKHSNILCAMSDSQILSMNVTEDGKLILANESKPTEDGLYLSIDSVDDVLVSSQSGSILIFDQSTMTLKQEYQHAHVLCGEDVPVWCVANCKENSCLFVSGGDDSIFRTWDSRQAPPTGIIKHHSAGATCASFWTSSSIVTGSYDESICLWDTRCLRQPLGSVDMGGGVWRVKRTRREGVYLCACMHGGSKVVDWSSAREPVVLGEHLPGDEDLASAQRLLPQDSVFPPHLAYGIDCVASATAVSCSFYDNRLYFWSVSSDV